MPLIFNSFLCTWQLVFVISSCVTPTHNQNKRSKSGLSNYTCCCVLILHSLEVFFTSSAVFAFTCFVRWLEIESLYHPCSVCRYVFGVDPLYGFMKTMCCIFMMFAVGRHPSWNLSSLSLFTDCVEICMVPFIIIIIIIIIILIIGSTTLSGPWPPQANVASDLCPGHSPSSFCNPVFLASSSTPSIHFDFRRPRPRWPAGFVHNIFLGNLFLSIRTTWPAHLSLLDFITLTIFSSL